MGIFDIVSSKKLRTTGIGSFRKKFYAATKYGGLKNLRNNTGAIREQIEKNKLFIRRGQFGRLERRGALEAIMASDKKINKGDKRDIKKILESFSGQGK